MSAKGKTKSDGIPGKTGFDASRFTTSPEKPPDDIPIRLKEDICRWKREVDKHRDYFIQKGINPFLGGHEIILNFLNNFDKLAGMKAK